MLQPPIEPMLAAPIDRIPDPADCPGGCRYEPKWDGFRALLFVLPDRIYLQSRSGKPLGAAFPDIRRLAAEALPEGSVLDGELVAWQAQGRRTDFSALQRRLVAGRRLPAEVAAAPATYVAFDLLALTTDWRSRPLRERRQQLEVLLEGAPPQLPLCPHTSDLTLARTWVSAGTDLGVEGLVIKPAASAYRAGRRAGGWRKWRTVRTAEGVVGDVTGSLSRPDTLLVGRYDLRGRLRLVARTRPLTIAQAQEVSLQLTPAAVGRQRSTHPWPQPLPAGWLGRWGESAPLAYRPVEPTLIAELTVDTSIDAGRWRHSPRLIRVRSDLSVFDVPPYRDNEPT
jgi:ATP-dependent DNA ligase